MAIVDPECQPRTGISSDVTRPAPGHPVSPSPRLLPVASSPDGAAVFADGHLRAWRHAGAVVASIDGALDRSLAELLESPLRSIVVGASHVIIDVDRAVLADKVGVATAVTAVRDAGDDSTELCLVASRMSSRLLLARWGIDTSVPVFTSVADALQALTFQLAGFGDGWG